ADAGRADRIDDFGRDVSRFVPAFVLGNQRRVVLEVERVVQAHGVHAGCDRARCIARAIPAASETAPIAAVNTAPPMIAITSNDAPSLRSLSPKPSTPSAKIV